MSVAIADKSNANVAPSLYTSGDVSIQHVAHTLAETLGGRQVDTFICEQINSERTTLVFVFRAAPLLSNTDVIRTQVSAVAAHIYKETPKTAATYTHGKTLHWTTETFIGSEQLRGAILITLPHATWTTFNQSLPQGLSLSSSSLFCLLATESELHMAQQTGATRLLAMMAAVEGASHSSPQAHLYPFPIYSDLTRTKSVLPIHQKSTNSAVSCNPNPSSSRPSINHSLSKKEQLRAKLKQKRQEELVSRSPSPLFALPPSILDRVRVFRLYGSTVHLTQKTIVMQIDQCYLGVKTVLQKLDPDEEKPTPIAFVTRWAEEEDQQIIAHKAWNPEHTTAGLAPYTLIHNTAPPSPSSTPSRVFGSFICFFPSGVDEGREKEDGFVVFLSPDSWRATMAYLKQGNRLAMLPDTKGGLGVELCWTASKFTTSDLHLHPRDDDSLTKAVLLQLQSTLQLTLQKVHLHAYTGAEAESICKQLVDYCVWVIRVIDTVLDNRKSTEASPGTLGEEVAVSLAIRQARQVSVSIPSSSCLSPFAELIAHRVAKLQIPQFHTSKESSDAEEVLLVFSLVV